MSQARQTQILESEIVAGWASKLITAAGAETKAVKATGGKVAVLLVNGAYDVTIKDGETAKWAAVNNTTLDLSRCPLQLGTSINLTFSGAGSAWIIYK